MHKIDAADFAPGNVFTDGDPLVPTPATVLDAAWLNAVQAEVLAVLASAGIGPVKGTNTQLRDSIRRISYFTSQC